MSLRLHVIIGSTRPGRVGPAIAQWVARAAADHGRFEVELVDLADFHLPLLDEAAHPSARDHCNEPTRAWSASVDAADAFVFVTPEYDHFPPASLVNAIQALMPEWSRKVAGVVCYGGLSGGMRASVGLRQLLGNVNVHAVPQVVAIHGVAQAIGGDGAYEPSASVARGAAAMLDELHAWATALRTIRQP